MMMMIIISPYISCNDALVQVFSSHCLNYVINSPKHDGVSSQTEIKPDSGLKVSFV